MADDKKFDLSRRKVLGSIGTIGVASAAAGAGTMAWFKDKDTVNNNTVTAGTLDLMVDWTSTYNGATESTSTGTNGPAFNFNDVKPGDSGTTEICLSSNSNPAYVWANATLTANKENGQNDPESSMSSDTSGGDPGAGNGELADAIECDLFYKGTNQRVVGSDTMSLRNLIDAINGGVQLDGKPNNSNDKQFPADTKKCHVLEWKVPLDSVGNEIQSDSLKFNLSYYAQQARHRQASNPY